MTDIRITVDGQRITGKYLAPETSARRHPAILFVHGWGGSQRRDVAKARRLMPLGYACLTFNLRGHARTRRQINTVTRAQNLRDVLAGYDFLVRQPGLDPAKIAVVGTSYGGYLAALLTTERSVCWLALRAPALYMDADFDRPKRELNLDASLSAYRRLPLSEGENRALSAAARFTGDVLIVESEQDALIPHQVIENYLRAFARSAHSVTHRILRGADHALDRAGSRRRYRKILEEWFRNITKTEAQPAAVQQGVADQ